MKLIFNGDGVTTTVGELVAELSKLDPNTLVFTEGCDCVGNVVRVSTQHDGSVLIERDDLAVVWSPDANKFVVSDKYLDRMAP